MKIMKFTFLGRLQSGEAVFVDAEDNILIERDHRHLTGPTPVEWKEANRIWNQKNNAEALNPAGVDRASTAAGYYGHNDKAAGNRQ